MVMELLGDNISELRRAQPNVIINLSKILFILSIFFNYFIIFFIIYSL